MSNPPPDLTEIRDIIDGRYIVVLDACREDELGTICKAYDREGRSRSRYVALLRLHQWCKHLPNNVQNRLIESVEAARKPLRKKDDTAKVDMATCRAINCVIDYKLFGKRPEGSKEYRETLDFIVTEWVEQVTIEELLSNYIKAPSDALQFIYHLSKQLTDIYSASKHLRPAIALDQLRVRPDQKEVGGVLLGGWRFNSTLDENNERTKEQEREDTDRLIDLLLQLLYGLVRIRNKKPIDEEIVPFSAVKKAYKKLSVDITESALWSKLEELQDPNSPKYEVRLPQYLADSLTKPEDLACSLNKALEQREEKDPAEKTPIPSTPAPPLQSPPDSALDDAVAGAEETGGTYATSQTNIAEPENDFLEITPLGMNVTAKQELWIRELDSTKSDAEKAKKAGLTSEIAQIGVNSIYDLEKPDHLFDDAQWLKELRQYRVYIQRHISSVDKLPYYTISDLGYQLPQRRTVVDGIRISPLFTTLLKPSSVIEIDDKYSVEFRQAAKTEQIGWVLAKEQGVSTLTVGEAYFRPLPTDNAITVPLTVSNPTNEVDRLTLVADGMPSDWPLPMPTPVSLYNQTSEHTPFTIPLPPFRLQGTYTLTIRLISDNVDAQVAATQIRVDVLPQYEYSGYTYPEIIRAGSLGELQIENRGNLHQDFTVSFRDRAGALSFNPEEVTVGVQPHYAGVVRYRAYTRKWRIVGRSKEHEINATVTPVNGGMVQTFRGQVISRALIPIWVPLLLGLFLLGIFLLYTFVLIPDFIEKKVMVNSAIVEAPAAGQEFDLSWQAAHSCFYSVYKNGSLFKPLKWNGAQAKTVPSLLASAGDEIELQLRGCTFLRTQSWAFEVAAAPTATAAPALPPKELKFSVDINNAESSGLGIGGRQTGEEQPRSPLRQVLIGQTGDLCFTWSVNEYNPQAFLLQIVAPPQFEAWKKLPLEEPEGTVCLPIAQHFTVPGEYRFEFVLADLARQSEQRYYEQLVNVTHPVCTVNTDATLLVREGPGRNFQQRGELAPQTEVFPINRPFVPGEQQPPEPWVAVTLAADPRPAWIAYNYLNCPVSIDPLPATLLIPPTPTPTPTPTAEPTATPIPESKPEFSIEPEIINLGGCAKITWKIQNVREVYLNNDGVVGESERQVCPKEAGEYKYTWRIVGMDGNISTKEGVLLVNPTGPAGPLQPPSN